MVLSNLDRTLLDRCLSRAEGAWEQFVDRFLPLIVHVVNQTGKTRLSSLPDGWRDDLVAEVLLALVDDDFAVLRRFQERSSLGTYLVVVARRVALHKLETLQRTARPTSGNGSAAHDKAVTSDDGPAHVERSDRVESLLKRLPEREAQAIRLFHFEHCSYREIGSHLGIPENSVGSLLSRARGRLRTIENSEGTPSN